MKAVKRVLCFLLSLFLVTGIFTSLPITAFAVENSDVYALSYRVGAYDMFPESDGSLSVTIDGTKYYYSDDYYDNIATKLPNMENQNVLYELHDNKIVKAYSMDEVLFPKITVESNIKEGVTYRKGKFSQESFDLVVKIAMELNGGFQDNDLLWLLNDTEKERLYTTVKKLEIKPSDEVNFGSSGWWSWKEYQTDISETLNDKIKVDEIKEYKYTVNLENHNVLNQREYNIALYITPTFDFGSYEPQNGTIKIGNLDYQEEKTEEKKVTSTSGKTVTKATTELQGVQSALSFNKNLFSPKQNECIDEFVNIWISELILTKYVDKSELKEKVTEKIANKMFENLGVDTSVMLIPGTIEATTYLQTETKDGEKVFIEFYINMLDFDFGNSGMPTMATGSGKATIYNMDGEKLDSSIIIPAYSDICAFCEQLQKVAKKTMFDAAKTYLGIFGVSADATAEALSSKLMTKLLNSSYTKDAFKMVDAKDVKKVLEKVIVEGEKKCNDKIFKLITTPSQGSTVVSVKCPVDVTVYDNDGNICGMVKDNIVETSYDDVFISVVGDQKNIYLIGDDYSFGLTGTDTGTMDYTVTEYDADGTQTREILYEDIALTSGCKYYTYVPEAENHNSVLFDLTDSEGNVISSTTTLNTTDDGKIGDIYWSLSQEGVLYITGSGGIPDYTMHIPPWYDKREQIKEIVMSEGITSIGKYSFYGCENLEKTNIPINIENIGYFAFANCSSLNTIDFEAKNWDVDYLFDHRGPTYTYFFMKTENIKTINIGQYVENFPFLAFYNMDKISNISVDEGNRYFDSQNNVIYSYDKTKLLFYPKGLTETYFAVPDGVTNIEWFYNDFLTTIYLPDSIVNNTKWEVCNNFDHLEDITSLRRIKCSTNVVRAVTDLVANKNNQPYFSGTDYDYCIRAIKEIEITDRPTVIEDYLFSRLRLLEKVVLPDTVKEIGREAFSHCNKLKEIHITKNIEKIADSAFWFCENLDTITVDNNNKNFVGKANCLYNYDMTKLILVARSITRLTIPEGVISIEDYALGDCKRLLELNIPNSLTNFGVFDFEECEKLLAINIADNNPVFSSMSGVLLNKAKTTLLKAPQGLVSYEIPETITVIDNSAFGSCDDLMNITIPDSVTSIKSDAFIGCTNLTSVVIPSSVTDIGDYAFGYYEYIYSHSYQCKKYDNFKIYGISGTVAELYANDNGFEFISLGTIQDEESQISGDSNGDGVVNAKDRMHLTRYLAKWSGYENIDFSDADVNNDGQINAKDRMILTRYLAKWSGYETLPYCT